jgi:hypothetical protein
MNATTTAALARRLLGTTHHGAGSRVGDLAEALRRLEAAERDLSDWRGYAPIPRSRCGVCGHLAVVSGYMCALCDADPDEEGACGSGCDPEYGCDCPPP